MNGVRAALTVPVFGNLSEWLVSDLLSMLVCLLAMFSCSLRWTSFLFSKFLSRTVVVTSLVESDFCE